MTTNTLPDLKLGFIDLPLYTDTKYDSPFTYNNYDYILRIVYYNSDCGYYDIEEFMFDEGVEIVNSNNSLSSSELINHIEVNSYNSRNGYYYLKIDMDYYKDTPMEEFKSIIETNMENLKTYVNDEFSVISGQISIIDPETEEIVEIGNSQMVDFTPTFIIDSSIISRRNRDDEHAISESAWYVKDFFNHFIKELEKEAEQLTLF